MKSKNSETFSYVDFFNLFFNPRPYFQIFAPAPCSQAYLAYSRRSYQNWRHNGVGHRGTSVSSQVQVTVASFLRE
jgi:hypothetical protein